MAPKPYHIDERMVKDLEKQFGLKPLSPSTNTLAQVWFAQGQADVVRAIRNMYDKTQKEQT